MYDLKLIGRVESPIKDRADAPKQGFEGAPGSTIVFEPEVLEALHAIQAGDRLTILTWLDRADRSVLQGHPRGDERNPLTGVFRTRSPHRPNPIGLHEVEVVALDGARLRVTDLEAFDGTPVVDVKQTIRPGEQLDFTPLLGGGDVATRLPAQDLDRARRFYSEKLGLEPAEERPGGLRYLCRSGEFAIFQSSGEPSGAHTQMAWDVDDLDTTVAELRRRGVVFEEYDVPGLKTEDGIATVEGNYPSKGGVGERGVWFYDSEGNLIGMGQRLV